MDRRQFVATIGIGSLASFGGCLSLSDGDDGSSEPPPLDGEWILRGHIVNTDDEPREWRLECRSQDRESVSAAWATIPANEEWEAELRGRLYDEQREVYVESDQGSQSVPWKPTECNRLFVEITISDGQPMLETTCREE